MRVGVEVGGTFTGLVAIEGGRVRIAKVPSTPARPDENANRRDRDRGRTSGGAGSSGAVGNGVWRMQADPATTT